MSVTSSLMWPSLSVSLTCLRAHVLSSSEVQVWCDHKASGLIMLATTVWFSNGPNLVWPEEIIQVQVQYINHSPELARVLALNQLWFWLRFRYHTWCSEPCERTLAKKCARIIVLVSRTETGCEQLSASNVWTLLTPFSVTFLMFSALHMFCEEVKQSNLDPLRRQNYLVWQKVTLLFHFTGPEFPVKLLKAFWKQ